MRRDCGKRQDEEQAERIMPLITAAVIVSREGMRWGAMVEQMKETARYRTRSMQMNELYY